MAPLQPTLRLHPRPLAPRSSREFYTRLGGRQAALQLRRSWSAPRSPPAGRSRTPRTGRRRSCRLRGLEGSSPAATPADRPKTHRTRAAPATSGSSLGGARWSGPRLPECAALSSSAPARRDHNSQNAPRRPAGARARLKDNARGSRVSSSAVLHAALRSSRLTSPRRPRVLSCAPWGHDGSCSASGSWTEGWTVRGCGGREWRVGPGAVREVEACTVRGGEG